MHCLPHRKEDDKFLFHCIQALLMSCLKYNKQHVFLQVFHRLDSYYRKEKQEAALYLTVALLIRCIRLFRKQEKSSTQRCCSLSDQKSAAFIASLHEKFWENINQYNACAIDYKISRDCNHKGILYVIADPSIKEKLYK